jgi:hypothetical protein
VEGEPGISEAIRSEVAINEVVRAISACPEGANSFGLI